MFPKPETGKVVSVTTDWDDYYKGFESYVRINGRRHTLTGVVVASEGYDDPATFRIRTDNIRFPISVVPLDRVCELVYDDGSQAIAVIQAELADEETWSVEGSKGAEYTVTRIGDRWGCTCPGYSFRATCKHVNAKKQEVLDRN